MGTVLLPTPVRRQLARRGRGSQGERAGLFPEARSLRQQELRCGRRLEGVSRWEARQESTGPLRCDSVWLSPPLCLVAGGGVTGEEVKTRTRL